MTTAHSIHRRVWCNKPSDVQSKTEPNPAIALNGMFDYWILSIHIAPDLSIAVSPTYTNNLKRTTMLGHGFIASLLQSGTGSPPKVTQPTSTLSLTWLLEIVWMFRIYLQLSLRHSTAKILTVPTIGNSTMTIFWILVQLVTVLKLAAQITHHPAASRRNAQRVLATAAPELVSKARQIAVQTGDIYGSLLKPRLVINCL